MSAHNEKPHRIDPTVDLPKGTHILPDAIAVARAAAEKLIAMCATASRRNIAICLAGGGTPKLLYALLAQSEYISRIPWPRIHWFMGDDRMVPIEDERSNAGMARAALGPNAPIPPGNFYPMRWELGTPACAADYDRTLRDFHGGDTLRPESPLFDLVLLGLGEDGHTASLFPGVAALEESIAWAAPVSEPGLAPFVPRVTLTYPALASARLVMFLATGAGKREPLRRLAASEDLPAGRVTSNGRLLWLLDAAAAGV